MRRLILSLAAFSVSLQAQTPAIITIDQAIEEAIANNLDLAATRYNITIAEARQITAKLRPNPVVSISADHLDLLGTGYNAINNGGPNEYSLRTDFVLERASKRTARIDLAASERSLAEIGVRDTIRRLIFEVQSAFVDAQTAAEVLKLATENLQRLNNIVEVNTSRVRIGDLAEVELNRSQVAALQFQTAVRQAELQLRQAKTRLQLLMGRNQLLDNFGLAGPIRNDEPAHQLEDLRAKAQAQRPDLQLSKGFQARNQADLRLQLAQGKIDYTAGTEYRRQQAPTSYGNSLGFFVSAPLPVFNRNQGEIARAQRELNQAAAQARAAEARVNGEVVSAWQQYSMSFGILRDIEKRLLTTSRDVLQATEYSYRKGEATLVEFLDAQRAFSDVMQSYNEARSAYAKALYLIDSVTAASVAPR